MFYKTIILSLGFLSLINCNAQKEPKTSEKAWTATEIKQTPPMKGENVIYLNEGENKFLKEYQMNVTFKGISEDSRCPKGVNCIWAGVAVAQVEVMGVATRPMTLTLASLDNKGRNYNKSADFNGFTISLAEVNPYPGDGESAKGLNGKYKIGIVIKKAGENSTTK
ncbi:MULTISPECIES: hypothetical protein [Chryseobacterium]|jgi:hypothetical protein|uniref:Lipoprotein n=1 Tax=Chryseobacterium geocarposphaerae TaxID=1416776 RepID=A0ABU1LAV5_9FLAO|nr:MULTISPECIES: hypothetical protein [Chryseobacterium]MDR6403852.1 hypothetical protein [Chryseobacterium geocarposphaerae]MDR6698629.1 hypothetical protein [Chryseobacterium ginsenosidimutans]